jgi:hypothetical protein
MDETEAKVLFFRLISDAREAERQKAFDALMGSDDSRMQDVARIGNLVSKVIAEKTGPSTLKEALEIGESLVQTSYWNGYFETCGQALLKKGQSMEAGEMSREILSWGISMMNRAMGVSTPLSDESIAMIREAKKTDAALSEKADAMIIANESLAPRYSALKEERAHAPEKGKKKRAGR